MPPDNGGFLIAAYVAGGTIYLGYAILLWRRARRIM